MANPDSRATLAAGYAASTAPADPRAATLAASWRYNSVMEGLLVDPAAAENLTTNLRTRLGYYAEGRAAAVAAGVDIDAAARAAAGQTSPAPTTPAAEPAAGVPADFAQQIQGIIAATTPPPYLGGTGQ